MNRMTVNLCLVNSHRICKHTSEIWLSRHKYHLILIQKFSKTRIVKNLAPVLKIPTCRLFHFHFTCRVNVQDEEKAWELIYHLIVCVNATLQHINGGDYSKYISNNVYISIFFSSNTRKIKDLGTRSSPNCVEHNIWHIHLCTYW